MLGPVMLAGLALAGISTSSALAARAPHANLAVELSGPRTAQIGERLTYTATVRDVGGTDASLAALRYIVPARADGVAASASQGTCSATAPTSNAPSTAAGSIVTCELGTIARGQTATVTIAVTAGSQGYALNRVWVASGLPDRRRFNNHADVVTYVRGTPSPPVAGPHANLALELAGPKHVRLSEHATYTATVTNRGPHDATQVALRNIVSGKVGVVSTTPSQGSCATNTRTIDCELGTLAVGQSSTVTIVVTAQQRGYAIDHAWTASGLPDRRQFNNHHAVVTFVQAAAPQPAPKPVLRPANLALRLTGPARARVGGQVTYVATVRNLGPAAITHIVTLRDQLPARMSFVSVATSQGTCAASGRMVTCDLHALARGSSATVTITAGVQRSGAALDHTWVWSGRVDMRKFNNHRDLVTNVAGATASSPDTTSTTHHRKHRQANR
jgi:uncharacterized repeat protein (TIGR01451 family)